MTKKLKRWSLNKVAWKYHYFRGPYLFLCNVAVVIPAGSAPFSKTGSSISTHFTQVYDNTRNLETFPGVQGHLKVTVSFIFQYNSMSPTRWYQYFMAFVSILALVCRCKDHNVVQNVYVGDSPTILMDCFLCHLSHILWESIHGFWEILLSNQFQHLINSFVEVMRCHCL